MSHIVTDDPATYDLLFLHVISTSWLQFYSGGGARTRFEKTKALANYEPAKKYLHVCTDDTGPNCNVCAKCIRTLVMLDALGHLDDFSEVFDIRYYRANRNFYLKAMYWAYLMEGKVSFFGETYEILKKDLTFGMRCAVWYAILRRKVSNIRFLSVTYHKMIPRRTKAQMSRKENFGSLPARGK